MAPKHKLETYPIFSHANPFFKDFFLFFMSKSIDQSSSSTLIPKRGLYMMTDHFRWEDLKAVMPVPR